MTGPAGSADGRATLRQRIIRVFVFVVYAVGTTVLLFAAFDRLIVVHLMPEGVSNIPDDFNGLFPPYSSYEARTAEFSYSASINNHGFRGPSIDADTLDRRVVVALLGDSFTYGWGLDYDRTWGAIVDSTLRSRGIPSLVANLGKPGYLPSLEVQPALLLFPTVRPDVVIVNVHQQEDAYQELELRTADTTATGGRPRGEHLRRMLEELDGELRTRRPDTTSAEPGFRELVKASFHILFPNTLRWINVRRWSGAAVTESEARAEWVRQYQELLDEYASGSEEALIEQTGIDPSVMEMFREGHISPNLLARAIRQPDYYHLLRDPGSPDYELVRDHMAEAFRRIKWLAAEYGAREVLVSFIPDRAYVSPHAHGYMRRMGFQTDSAFLQTDASERIVREAAAAANVPFSSALDLFREHGDEVLFYNWDGHFTPRGSRLYAEHILRTLDSRL